MQLQSATYIHPLCDVVIQTNAKITSEVHRSAGVIDSRTPPCQL